jgi:hypothetical protein
METKTSHRIVDILRWFVFLPGAALGAGVAWILINTLGGFGLGFVGIGRNSFIAQFYFNTAGHALMGAAFVYVGAKIVPSNQKIVAYILAGLGLVLAGFGLFPSIMLGSGWAIWGSICVVNGIGAVIYLINRGETNIE